MKKSIFIIIIALIKFSSCYSQIPIDELDYEFTTNHCILTDKDGKSERGLKTTKIHLRDKNLYIGSNLYIQDGSIYIDRNQNWILIADDYEDWYFVLDSDGSVISVRCQPVVGADKEYVYNDPLLLRT